MGGELVEQGHEKEGSQGPHLLRDLSSEGKIAELSKREREPADLDSEL